jgi:hypothetical protein
MPAIRSNVPARIDAFDLGRKLLKQKGHGRQPAHLLQRDRDNCFMSKLARRRGHRGNA